MITFKIISLYECLHIFIFIYLLVIKDNIHIYKKKILRVVFNYYVITFLIPKLIFRANESEFKCFLLIVKNNIHNISHLMKH